MKSKIYFWYEKQNYKNIQKLKCYSYSCVTSWRPPGQRWHACAGTRGSTRPPSSAAPPPCRHGNSSRPPGSPSPPPARRPTPTNAASLSSETMSIVFTCSYKDKNQPTQHPYLLKPCQQYLRAHTKIRTNQRSILNFWIHGNSIYVIIQR